MKDRPLCSSLPSHILLELEGGGGGGRKGDICLYDKPCISISRSLTCSGGQVTFKK
jgi:hypothetical protein